MAKIYVIVSRSREVYGHGDFGSSYKLAMTGSYDTPPPHPAFLLREDANNYLSGLKYESGMEIMELEIISDSKMGA